MFAPLLAMPGFSGMSDLSNPLVIRQILIEMIALILSIAVHEFGHAFVADRLGDRLPRSQGRVTLNPIAHIDLLGTIVIPLASAVFGVRLLGWGKPVQTSARASFLGRRMSTRTADLLISLAGPGMNLLIAAALSIVFALLLHLGFAEIAPDRVTPLVPYYVEMVIGLNIGLAIFNLIPLPPLDGRSVLFWFLPSGHPIVRFLEQYGPFIFIALFATGILSIVMAPAGWLISAWLDLLHRWTP